MRRRRKNPVEERFRRRGVNVRGVSRYLDGRVRVTYSDGKSKTFRAKRNPGHMDPRATIYGKQIGRKKRSVLSALTTADAVRAIRKVMPGRSKEAYAHMAREHQNRAAEYRKVWSRVADKAAMRAFGRKFQSGDYQISGIGSDAFDERSKSILRTAAVRGGEHARIAAALKVLAGAKMRKVYKLNPCGRRGNPEAATHVLLRDGKEVYRGTANGAIQYIHRHHSYSYAHALKYEGYERKKLSDQKNPLGRVAPRGFVRVRRSVTPQFIARRAGVPVSRILSIIGR